MTRPASAGRLGFAGAEAPDREAKLSLQKSRLHVVFPSRRVRREPLVPSEGSCKEMSLPESTCTGQTTHNAPKCHLNPWAPRAAVPCPPLHTTMSFCDIQCVLCCTVPYPCKVPLGTYEVWTAGCNGRSIVGRGATPSATGMYSMCPAGRCHLSPASVTTVPSRVGGE